MKRLERVIPYRWMVLVLWLMIFSPRMASAHIPPLPPFPYQEQGSFVEIPAMTGGILFGISGAVAGPVACLLYLRPSGNLLDEVKVCSVMGAWVSSLAGSTVVGLPFYIVKKTFWDFPRWLRRLDRPQEGGQLHPTPDVTS